MKIACILILSQNGFNPTWDESAAFTITRPDFAFLEFRVKTRVSGLIGGSSAAASTEEHLGSYVINLSLVRTGYRNVYLENYAGVRLTPASLFVHVSMEDVKCHMGKKKQQQQHQSAKKTSKADTWTEIDEGKRFRLINAGVITGFNFDAKKGSFLMFRWK